MLRRLHETANASSSRHRAASPARRGRRFQLPGARARRIRALYSFVDVFRLTVSGPIAGPASAEPAAEAPIRVAAPQAQPGASRASRSAAAREPDNGCCCSPAWRSPAGSRTGAWCIRSDRSACCSCCWSAVRCPAGCERAAADRPAAQLVAKVNGTEISVHQLRVGGAGTTLLPRRRRWRRSSTASCWCRRRSPPSSIATRRCAVDRERAPPAAGAGLSRARRLGGRRQHARRGARLLRREPGAVRRAAHLPPARAGGVGAGRDDRRAARRGRQGARPGRARRPGCARATRATASGQR